MKARILAACICLVVIGWFLLPYASRHREPVYRGRPLHEWAIDTQGQNLDFSPSPEALEAARAVQAIGPAAIPWLIRWIRPPVTDSRLPGGAVESFKILGTRAESAIPELAAILNKPARTMDDKSSQISAAEALSWLGPKAIPFMLTAATNLQGQHIQWQVIQDFGNLGTNGVSVIPALIGWTQDTDAWVRLGAVIALGEIGLKPGQVVPVLHEALKDSDPLVRSYAAGALGNFGKAAKDTVPDLIKLLKDPDGRVQAGAMDGLVGIGEQKEIVLPLLARELHSGNWTVRRAAAFSLGDLGGQRAFDLLMQSTDDPEGFVREAVFQSLKKIDAKQLEKSGKKFH